MRRGYQSSSDNGFLRIAAAALLLVSSARLLHGQVVAEPGPSDATAASFTRRGTVVNGITHQPIPRALVQCADKAVLTDGDGRFELTCLPEMTGIQVKKPGFLTPDPPPWQGGIAIGPDPPELTLSLTPEAIITGQLTLPSTEAAEGVYVALHRRSLQDGRPLWTQTNGVMTNSKGIYRFADLGPGAYYLSTQVKLDPDAANLLAPEAAGHGFPPVYYGSGPELSTASQFTLTGGQHLQADLALARQSFYKVTVSIMNILPGESIQPDILDQGNQPTGYPAQYDPQHQLIRASLPNGAYTLRARSFDPKRQRLGQVSITVTNKPLTALSVALSPLASIPVVVRRDYTETAAEQNPTIDLYAVLQSMPGEAQPREEHVVRQPSLSLYLNAVDGTGPQGSLQTVPGAQEDDALELAGVPPGRYYVQAQAFQGYIASITSAGVDLTREPLVVGAGGSAGSIEVTLRRDTGTLKIALAQPDDSSAAAPTTAFVYVIPQFDFVGSISQLFVNRQNPSQAVAMTNGVSMATASTLAPGTYRVYTFATAHDLEYRNPEAMQPYASQSQTVTVTAHETTSIEVKLPAPAE